MNDILREFLLETHENLAHLDLDLIALEKSPDDPELLARIFRTLHTVKGTAGFLGLAKLQGVTHAGENLLSRLRAKELAVHAEIATALLGVVDAIRQMLTSVETTENEGDGDYSALIQTLQRLTNPPGGKVPQAAPPQLSVVASTPSQTVMGDAFVAAPTQLSVVASIPPETIVAGTPAPIAAADPPQLSVVASIPPQTVVAGPAPRTVMKEPPQPVPPQLSVVTTIPPKTVVAPAPVIPTESPPLPIVTNIPSQTIAAPAPAPALIITPEPVESRAPAVADSSIRVDVGLLDKLMNLVGELVLARNQVLQFSADQDDDRFLGTVHRLNRLTTELQAGVMKTRMQPIGQVWTKFPRLVRDLSVACGKQVRLELEGQETELDKSIIEAIRDPLTHMVRNAVDHGIETPAERMSRGKPSEGRLLLRASHEGGKVIIEIADDGGGIDLDRVRDKAIAANLISMEQAARLNDRELLDLVFRPGFSTADRVTQFSGRGVGMDVVRTNIEKIGGTVDLESQHSHGTTVRMMIPLTLAIIPALTVSSGGSRYAIPQVSLLELLHLDARQAQAGIEQIHGATVYRLRGDLLPLVRLDALLEVETTRSDDVSIVVLQADDRPFGLIVDEIHDTEEIVVKPLQKQLKGIAAFSGATIMGDGSVALILDVLGLAQRAGLQSGLRERTRGEKPVAETVGERQTLLLCSTHRSRFALPLSSVTRLEEFPRSALERVGGHYVVQYRGNILPLIRISDFLRGQRRKRRTGTGPKRETIQVVVHTDAQRQVGLIVGRILDIVQETVATRSAATRPGVLYTAVIQDRVVEFLDVDDIVRRSEARRELRA